MSIRKLLDLLIHGRSRTTGHPARRGTCSRRPASCRLAVEPFEDRLVPATLSISDVTVIEGVSGTKSEMVMVSLSEPSTKTVTVNYSTANGSAFAGSDYDKASGKLSFAPGETSKSIVVRIRGDQVTESTERFYVNLSNAKNATIADGQGVVTIVDSTPRLAITGLSTTTEGELMTFTVTLSAPLATAFTVDFRTADYTTDPQMLDAAREGYDYVATSGTLTFAPGETSKTFTVQTLADGLEEYDELFLIWFSNPSDPAVIIATNGWFARISGELGEW